MNKVVLIGRLTKDPELKFTSGTGVAVSTFTLAVDNPFKKDENGNRQADFINIVAWNKTAELIANYTHKGSLLGVSGRIQTRSYDAKDSTKRYVTEVITDEIQFLESKKDSVNPNNNSSNNNLSGFGDENITPIDDSDIPF